MRIFITGGTGLVGKRLVPRLLERGDQVVVLTRRPDISKDYWGGKTVSTVQGDPMQTGPWQDSLAECDAVVNLAGEGLFNRRWSTAFKELLHTSRIKSTENVAVALGRQPRTAAGTPKVLISGSAIGFYGFTGDEELSESSPAGNDFLAQLSIDWEKAAMAATPLGCRVVLLRTGVVLDRAGGALQKMLLPFKLFAGGPIGSGKQYVSWIHVEDLVGIILLGLDNAQAVGPINGTAPQPVTNREFARALGRALHRPSFMPTPGFALRVALGKVADLVTKGQRVVPRKALELGYKFQCETIDAALARLFAA
jgi:uncharacterized protein (TIGR01777 family)